MTKKRTNILWMLALLAGIALLSAVFIPNRVRARSRGSVTACKSNLKNIGTACEMYSSDWDGQYPKEIHLLTPTYLKTIPECPDARKDTYSESYSLTRRPVSGSGKLSAFKTYHIYCKGKAHKAVSLPEDYPQYDGIRGLIER